MPCSSTRYQRSNCWDMSLRLGFEGAEHPSDGGDPGWLTFTPDSKTVYVANAAANVVSAIDVKTMKEVARIPVGKQPDHVETFVLP